jgi:hypothetical protein
MSGVKGKSGPKTNFERFEDGTLLAMTTSYLIANWYKFDDKQKLQIALPVALKGISDKHEHKADDLITALLEINAKKPREIKVVRNRI